MLIYIVAKLPLLSPPPFIYLYHKRLWKYEFYTSAFTWTKTFVCLSICSLVTRTTNVRVFRFVGEVLLIWIQWVVLVFTIVVCSYTFICLLPLMYAYIFCGYISVWVYCLGWGVSYGRFTTALEFSQVILCIFHKCHFTERFV